MNKYQEVSHALKALQDALNKIGADIDISVTKISTRMVQDEHPKYIYELSASVKELISS